MQKINCNLLLLVAILTLFIIQSCQQSEYYKMESRELASGHRNDSLFFGLHLGMSSKDFYTHCWDLNQQGLVRQGAGNTTVLYEIEDFKYPAAMNFYPKFHDDKIIEMPLTFTYQAWSPWNKHLSSDSLKLEVFDLMRKWYGKGFLEIPNPNKGGSSALVKIDDNRRISIYTPDESKVSVDIVDLRLKKSIESQQKEQ